MKIAVITPYYKESIDVLKKCHTSVINQQVNATLTHFLIADGFPLDEINLWDAKHITLSDSHDDNGNTPRGLGSLLAKSEGFDFIAYLDADNWYHENHLQSMLDNWSKYQTPVVCCYRTFHHEDGGQLSIEEPIENSLDHVDTSCFFLHKTCFEVLDIWMKMPKILSPICDRVFYAALKNKSYKISYTRNRTVAFRSKYLSHYLHSHRQLPLNLKTEDVFASALTFLNTKEGISECIEMIGFWPLTYIKSFNILFFSSVNCDLSFIAEMLISALSNRRFIGYTASLTPNDPINAEIFKLANEVGYPSIKLKPINIDKLKLEKIPMVDFIINICENETSEAAPFFQSGQKIINWKIDNLPSSENFSKKEEFNKVLMIMKLKIERLISIPSEAINLEIIESTLNT